MSIQAFVIHFLLNNFSRLLRHSLPYLRNNSDCGTMVMFNNGITIAAIERSKMILILVGLMLWGGCIQAHDQYLGEISRKPIQLLEPEPKNQPKQKIEPDVTKKSDIQNQSIFNRIGSFFSNKTISNMTFAELKAEQEQLIQNKDKAGAVKYLEKMVPLCNDLDELKKIMLELASIYYEIGNFEKAGKMYNEFTVLYPGCDEAEFALYQAILSSFKLTLDAEHDQGNTQEAKELALAFLERESFKKYRKEVKDILNKCEERLFEADSKIFSFYLNCGNYLGEYGNAKKHLLLSKNLIWQRNS